MFCARGNSARAQHERQSMNIRKHSLGTVLAVLGTSALAATQSLPLPPAGGGYVDTESSTNILFVGFNDLTRFKNVHAEVFASLASCVQVAFGGRGAGFASGRLALTAASSRPPYRHARIHVFHCRFYSVAIRCDLVEFSGWSRRDSAAERRPLRPRGCT